MKAFCPSSLIFFFLFFLPPVYQFPSKTLLAAADLGRLMPLARKQKILIEHQKTRETAARIVLEDDIFRILYTELWKSASPTAALPGT